MERGKAESVTEISLGRIEENRERYSSGSWLPSETLHSMYPLHTSSLIIFYYPLLTFSLAELDLKFVCYQIKKQCILTYSGEHLDFTP